MRRSLAQVADRLLAGEPLGLLLAVPLLIFPRGYLWQWQQGLFHYAPIGEASLRYPGPLSGIGLSVVALFWLLRLVRQGRPVRPTVLDLPIALYLLTAVASLWPSVDRAHSLNFLLLLIAGVALYYGLVNAVDSPTRLHQAVALFMAGGVALSVVGLFQTDWAQLARKLPLPGVYDRLQHLPHPLGRTLNLGITAGASVLFIPLGCSLALTARRWRDRFLAAGATVCPAGFLLLSQSRGDILALALTIPALGLWRLRRGHLWLGGTLLGLYGLLAGLVLYAPGLVARFAYLYPSRWQVWERAAYLIRDHPLTGVGLDTFRLVARHLYPYFDYAVDQTVNAHNRLLQVGVDQGVPGLVAFAALIVLFLGANHRAWQVAGTRFQRDLALGLGGGFIAFMLGSLFDDGVLTGRAGLAAWYLLGLGMAQARLGVGEAGLTAPLPVRRWLGRRESRALAGAVGLLVMALSALALSSIVWHNGGNVARNQGWLSVDAPTGVRQARALQALSLYERAGRRAARDRGALIYLAWDGQQAAPASDFFLLIAARTSAAEGVADLEMAVAEDPGDRFAHLYLAEAYRAAGRLSDAAAEYRRAGAPVEWVVAEGQRRWEWGRGDEAGAVAQLTIATLMDPQAAGAYYALGLVHEGQKRYDQAAGAYRAAADLYRDQGMEADAIQAYSRLLRIEPDNAYAQAELARLQGQTP